MNVLFHSSVLIFLKFLWRMNSKSVASLFSGKDGGKDRLLPDQLPHKSASVRKGFQDNARLCREQRDGANHTEERSGNDANVYEIVFNQTT